MAAEAPDARLRALYAAQGGVTDVFNDKAGDYAAARPAYPPQVFSFLRAVVGVPQGAAVADVGAGTGLFTAGLLGQGWQVLAVEPSAPMREAADARFRDAPGYASAAGTAEALPVADRSLDLITAAQAFHWFDIARARAKFLRALKPGAPVALVWNDRQLADPLHQALDTVFAAFGGEKREAVTAQAARRGLPGFFGRCVPAELHWPHTQALTHAGLQSLVFSRSYMPAQGSERGQAAQRAVSQVFAHFADGDTVAVRYTAIAFVGRPDAG